MRSIQTLIIFICICNISFAQDCSRIHIGKFKVVDTKTNTTYSIVRDDSTQTEVNSKTGATFVFKLRWINDCSYGLIPKKNVGPDVNPGVPSDMVLLIKIVEVKKKYYKTITTSNKLESAIELKIEILKP